jgi:endonuclease V-like protein UPF0215 family
LPIHIEKKAIRALGVAESFSASDQFSVLGGVVMRSDLVIDGFGPGRLEISGSDATSSIVHLFDKLERNDINVVLISGSVLSLYNIIDIEYLSKHLRKPIIALTFKKSKSNLARNIKAKFEPKVANSKISFLEKLGVPKKLKLETGYRIFVRAEGTSGDEETKRILDKFTLQGAVPEPIRVARLFAKTLASSLRNMQ